MGEERKVYKVLVGRPEGKRPLGRPRRRWDDEIRVDLRETGWGVWSGFRWLRIGTGNGLFRNTVINLRVLAPRSQLLH
jgi:hypothetical protein